MLTSHLSQFLRWRVPWIAIILLGGILSGCQISRQDPPARESDRPNFVFIAVDDLNIYNTVQGSIPGNFLEKIYPDPKLRQEVIQRLTPNLNRLAAQSLTFDRSYCASPLCGPSRTALMTGVPPHISGYYKHDQHFRGYETLTDVLTLPQHLKEQGYFTSGIGKVFHKGRSYLDRGIYSDWPDQVYSWTHWVESNVGTGPSKDAKTQVQETLSPYWNQQDLSAKSFTRFGITNLPREESNDYRNAKHIAELLVHGKARITDVHNKPQTVHLPDDQPFFLACGLFAPHLPWVVPQTFMDLFPQSEMAIDEALLQWVIQDLEDLSPTGQKVALHSPFTELREYAVELAGSGAELEAWKTVVQAYLATIAFSDANIGELLLAVEQQPRRENTIVMLWSDHGYHMGDKNRKGKTTLWEASNRCNLIIQDPRRADTHAGQRTSALASLQDLYPTISALAGLEIPAHVHGQDLSPLLDDPQTPWPHAVLNTYGAGNHALRTDQFRYLRFNNGDQELYDLQQDPFEETNLAQDPAFQPTLEALDRQLNSKLAYTRSDI
ncbi:sulfatase [Pontibacter sp. G13]|uniref:sulfatase n=1 Tax=Pontibacter sp. G13 TaxID=3074898 RepID=UPI00288BEBB8|nr:sulfatase [Pontibacter sp. G13]WNJ19119.1 sulfatase [Pontibacter sp. G13]